MQLHNLFQPMGEMTDEQLRERIQQIRHNRAVERPAAKARVQRSENKGRSAKISKAESLLAGLTQEQIQQLMLELGAGQ